MSNKEIPRETEKTKLTRAQRREIDAVIKKYKGDGKPRTAQASIPYEAMYPDGVCRVSPGVFSKCIAFEDVSYQLAQPETRTAIFEHLCDLYNYVDASIHVQFSFLNRKVDPAQYAKSFEIAPQGDDFDDIRAEYTCILQRQLAGGNNGIVKTKYMTFTIEADNLKVARARLNRIGLDLLGYFKTMGAVAHVMNGKERLCLLHGVFHPDGELFNFDWKWLAPSGLSTKDFVAPSSLCFGNAKTFGEVQGDLSMLFDKQYILTENVVVETRYRTETSTDPETGETTSEEVPYDYYICYVTLENFDLSHVPVYIMDEEKLSFYALYMSTLGNRPDLFSGSQYPNASTLKPPTYYDVPPEALEDATFAAMLKEAEKYIGYPYVWGGSSPSTSFGCSGFISWVINHSGWSVGRLGAQGLYNICTPVSASQAKPGDLVFFVGTYDTPGVSHVGLYVGDSMMLHCGDPISYTNLNSNYWQSHFYSYGRLP